MDGDRLARQPIRKARPQKTACVAQRGPRPFALSMSLTQKWLRQAVLPYSHSDRAYAHIDAALARFPTLRPKADVYTYDDGRTQLLLCTHGLLPISFRNASYNIPVALWVPLSYPQHPPISYVVPAPGMLVKAGKFVDVSGKCTIQYIQQWERKSEGCNLSALLEAMQDQFSREPPVYSRPPDVRSSSAPDYTERPPPPLPRPDRPLLPPKPSPSAPSGSRSPPQPQSVRPDNHSQSAPSDPGPPQYKSPHPIPPVYLSPQRNPGHEHHESTPYTSPVTSPPLQVPPQSVYQPQPHPPPPPPPPPPTHHAAPNLLEEDFSGPQPPVASFVPPPPRPPNPELLYLHAQVLSKLTSEYDSVARALALDAERLRAHQADLLAGEPAIRDEMARLEAVRDVCRSVSARMKGTVAQTERNVSELRRKGDPEVDELVCSTTIVHNQLINLIAEDNAIEDTIYHLHRALNTSRIDLDRFLRTTRVLAEEQFMKRVLIEKIQSGISV